MINICIVYISKKGGFPHNGGGFHSLILNKADSHFTAKILNDLDMSDNNYWYAITTMIKHSEKTETSDEDRDKALRKIFRELKKETLNKELIFDVNYIFLKQKGV